MSDPSRPRQDEAVRANYRGEEAREKHLSGEQPSSPHHQPNPRLGHEAASLNTTCDMSSHLA